MLVVFVVLLCLVLAWGCRCKCIFVSLLCFFVLFLVVFVLGCCDGVGICMCASVDVYIYSVVVQCFVCIF